MKLKRPSVDFVMTQCTSLLFTAVPAALLALVLPGAWSIGFWVLAAVLLGQRLIWLACWMRITSTTVAIWAEGRPVQRLVRSDVCGATVERFAASEYSADVPGMAVNVDLDVVCLVLRDGSLVPVWFLSYRASVAGSADRAQALASRVGTTLGE